MICNKYFKVEKELILPRHCTKHVWPGDGNVTLIHAHLQWLVSGSAHHITEK